MRHLIIITGLCVAFLIASFQSPTDPGRAPKRQKLSEKKIVFIAGVDSHGRGDHEHSGGSRLLAKMLNEHAKGFKAVVVTNGWPADASILNDADAIVTYCDGAERHVLYDHLEETDKLMKKGVGLVNLHYAVEVPKGRAGNAFLNWVGGYFELWYSVNPVWTARIEALPKHPITNGVKPFELLDEWYYHMRFVDGMKNVTPILRLLPPASTLERGDGQHSNNEHVRRDVLERKEPQTLAWAYERPGGGRGFGFTGGHIHNNWKHDDYRMLVLNAIVWAANGKVPKGGITTPTPSQAELDSYLRPLEQPQAGK
ncbi:ThuA domain-containing protein [Larkinella harenae]